MPSHKSPKKSNHTVTITSGAYRGRPLKVPHTAHPMGSREKMALFNVLSPFLASASVFDGFCGSGALGLEAASRGVRRVVFADQSPAATRLVRENAKSLGLLPERQNAQNRSKTPENAPEIAILTTPVRKFTSPERFDLILLDPPYDAFDPEEFQHLAKNLAEDGRLALSHPRGTTPVIPGLELVSSRSYAGATISLFQNP